jgi:hypothetical protein
MKPKSESQEVTGAMQLFVEHVAKMIAARHAAVHRAPAAKASLTATPNAKEDRPRRKIAPRFPTSVA